ncbi:MAG: MBL fold metallo-hydrolase [Methanoregulaceae archaeon]
MRCTILASGSKGNCTYLEGEDSSILIDAGLPTKEILSRLALAGGDAGKIRGIFVTHEHGDHIRGLDVLARRLDIPIYGTEGTLREFIDARKTSRKPVRVIRADCGETVELDGFMVEPFATSHDACEPCGFRVREGDTSLGFCTDTGIITSGMQEILKDCDSLVLESNHCPDMLRNGPYPPSLKRRIQSRVGHLSNDAARTFLHELNGDLRTLILAHLSEVNNTPEKAHASGRDGLGLYYSDVTLFVASMQTASPCWSRTFEL